MSDLPSQEMEELPGVDHSWRLGEAGGEGGDEAGGHERRSHAGLLALALLLLRLHHLLLGLGGEEEGRVPPGWQGGDTRSLGGLRG